MIKYSRVLNKKRDYKTHHVSRLYLKLRSRFTIYFFLLIMLPLAAFAAISHLDSKAVLMEYTRDMSSMNINQEKNSVQGILGILETALKASVSDGYIKELLYTDPGSKTFDSKIYGLLKNHLSPMLQKSLSGAFVLNGDRISSFYDRNGRSPVISDPTSQPWFTEALSAPDTVRFIGATQRFYKGGDSETVLSVAEAFRYMPAGSKCVLLLDFDYSMLSDIVAPDRDNRTGEQRIIIDEHNKVIYSLNPGTMTISTDPALSGFLGGGTEGFKNIFYENRNWYMSYRKFEEPPWTFVTMLPQDSIAARLSPAARPAVLAGLIIIPAVMLLFLAVSSILLRPINELTAVISGHESGHGTHREEKAAGMGSVLGFDKSKEQSEIDFLIGKVYDIRLKQKEAELNSLQNQINPHFLYNTLESIRGAALHHGLDEIAGMSRALSLLFRYSISDMVLVTIKEEIQHLENYMSIQNFRYENKFDLVYNVAPELYDYKILKLTLQPLIENSIKHGLEMKLGKGVIKIEILNLQNNIKIVVSDDGLGIPSKRVEELNRALSKDEDRQDNESAARSFTGIGVKNVNSRIKLYFGAQYGLKFRDVPAGTTVEITLPAVKGEM